MQRAISWLPGGVNGVGAETPGRRVNEVGAGVKKVGRGEGGRSP